MTATLVPYKCSLNNNNNNNNYYYNFKTDKKIQQRTKCDAAANRHVTLAPTSA